MTEKLFAEIAKERTRQDSLWGHVFDDKNTTNDWCSYFVKYAVYAAPLHKDDEFSRRNIVKLAALAVAALEAHDRNGSFPPRHYDSPSTSCEKP